MSTKMISKMAPVKSSNPPRHSNEPVKAWTVRHTALKNFFCTLYPLIAALYEGTTLRIWFSRRSMSAVCVSNTLSCMEWYALLPPRLPHFSRRTTHQHFLHLLARQPGPVRTAERARGGNFSYARRSSGIG